MHSWILIGGAMACIMMIGCKSSPTTTAKPTPSAEAPMITSEVLVEPLGRVLAEIVVERRAAGEDLPDDYATPEYLVSVIETMKLQYPSVFRVTPQQEARFAAGEFDDAANRRRIEQALSTMRQLDLTMPSISVKLAHLYSEGKLDGAGLELAARLFAAQLQTIPLDDEMDEPIDPTAASS